MKLRLLTLSISLAMLSSIAKAQLVGTDCFLQGAFLEIGCEGNGSFGTSTSPSGYHPHPYATSGAELAEVYDYGHDGWAVGSPPFMGDYTYPGSPFEGWEMQLNGSRSQAFQGYGTGYSGSVLSGAITAYTNTGGRATGTWVGGATAGGATLSMKQETRVDTNSSWVVVTTYFYNTSTTIANGVYYLRSCDPDDDQTWPGGSFSTSNIINYQNDVDHRVEVTATGPSPTHPTLSLCTKDCRALAFIYNSWPMTSSVDLSTIWSKAYTPAEFTVQTVDPGDIAIGLLYNLGNIAPGDSTFISYSYVFNGVTGIDSAFPEPQLVVNNVPIAPTDTAPSPTYDTFFTCNYPTVVNVPVRIDNASDKGWLWSKWTWAPSTGLTSTTGVTNTINTVALAGPTTYTITGNDTSAGGFSCNARTMYLTVYPCFHATSSNPCLGDTLYLQGHGDSTGATYQWTGPGGYSNTNQLTFIYPTTWADTGMYYVTKIVGSSRDTVHTHAIIRPLPLVTAGSNAPICSQTELSLTASAYTGGETYTWTGPNGFATVFQNPNRMSAPTVDAGVYKVVTMLNGCEDSSYISVVIDSTPAVPTVSSNAPICSRRDDLHFTSSDLTIGVSYTWTGPNGFVSATQNPSITHDVSVLYTGAYTVTAHNGTCTNSSTINIVVDKTPDLPITVNNGPVCTGNTLTLGATSDAGSIYSWVGPNSFYAVSQTPAITSVTMAAIGIYSVSATIIYGGIPAGCTSDTALDIVMIDSNVQAGFTYTKEYGCTKDTIVFTNTSIAANRFLWEFGDGNSSTDANPAHVYDVQAIDNITLYSSAGVCHDSAKAVINMLHPLHAQFSSDNTIVCQGTSVKFTDGSVATPSPTYLWNFGDGTTDPNINPAAHNYPNTGVYKVFEVVTDFVPCHDTAYEVIYVDSASPVHISLTDAALCRGTTITIGADYSQIGNTGIVWYLGNGDSVKGVNPLVYAYDTTGTFQITANALYRVCPEATNTRLVKILPSPSIDLGADRTICKGSDAVTISDIANTGSNGATWLWSTGQTSQSIVVTTPGAYSATVTIDGCTANGSVNVTNDCYMTIPNVFTPNGDGLNDYFFPRQLLTSGLTSFKIDIYNRWGTLVFESNSTTGSGWDGKLNGADQPEGVYVYIIDATFKDGEKEHHQGNLTLLR